MKRKATKQSGSKSKRRRMAKKEKKPTFTQVRRMIAGTQETKHKYWVPASVTMYDGVFYAMNPLYGISQGTGGDGMIGDELQLKSITINLHYETSGTSANGYINFAVIRSPKQISDLGNQDFNTATNTNFIYDSGGNASLWRLDPEKCTVVKRKRVRVLRYDSAANGKAFSVGARINKKWKINRDTQYGKFYNYYLVAWAQVIGGGLNGYTITSNVLVTYKDS